MKQELIYQSIEKATTWDIINSVETVEYDTQRSGSPGTLTFTAHLSGDLSFAPGDPVRFLVDGTIIFSGWVFTASYGRWGSVDVTAYDQLRYLKASASYAFYDMTAGQIIQQIAADFNLTVSTIEDTGYSIPSLIMEEKTCLDIISEAVQQTLLNTATMYIFFDDGTPSSDYVKNLIVSGAMSAGTVCSDAGEGFYPLAAFTVSYTGSNFGIYVKREEGNIHKIYLLDAYGFPTKVPLPVVFGRVGLAGRANAACHIDKRAGNQRAAACIAGECSAHVGARRAHHGN